MREHLRSGTEAVDGLRGIAIVLVLFYHTYLFSWYTPVLALFGYGIPVDVPARDGYLGVDLFFTISGFVLFLPYAVRALGGGGRPQTLGDFAFRRIVKIVPSYAIALAATAVVARERLAPRDVLPNLFRHAIFVQNMFPDGFGWANSVFWSLAVEMQFYVIFPLVAWTWRRLPVATPLAMFAVAFAYRHAAAPCCVGQESIMRALPAYLDVFASGMLAAYLFAWIRVRRPSLERHGWAFTLGAALFAWGAFRLMQAADTVQYVALGPERWDVQGRTFVALAAGGLTLCSCFALRFWRATLANPVLVFLSIVSYNVYLWHALLMIWMWQHDFPKAATANPHDDDHWKPIYIALGWTSTLLVATAITYFVERPLLGFVRPQTFAFDWSRIFGRSRDARVRPQTPAARPETRT